MKNYNEDYYIVDLTRDEDRIYAQIHDRSARRDFGRKEMLPGEPIFFENAYREEEKAKGIKHALPDILVAVADLVVSDQIKNFLNEYATDGLQLYPAIYIDDDGEWHEKFWCLNFYEDLDCWDREKSEVRETPKFEGFEDDDDDDDDQKVLKYHLNAEVLDQIPEENRLAFKMGGTMKPFVFVHQRVADFLNEIKATGIKLYPVSEFRDGMQYWDD